MKRGDEAAFALSATTSHGGATGMSKREYMSATILSGMLADANCPLNAEQFAEQAVKHADALLAELAK